MAPTSKSQTLIRDYGSYGRIADRVEAKWTRGTRVSLKSFIVTLAIFSGGYLSSTLLDEVIDAAKRYFHVRTSAYKTDFNGYIICSPEKPKITNAVGDATQLLGDRDAQ